MYNQATAHTIVATMVGYAKVLARHVCHCVAVGLLAAGCSSAPAQQPLKLSEVVDLALKNSGRYKAAEIDLHKASAALAATKDIYIPSIVIGGGLGDAYGITLSVPTIFTVNAQSLVFSVQQRFYIRAARSDFQAARLALSDAHDQAVEDAVTNCLALSHAQKMEGLLEEQYGLAQKLVSVVEDRVNAHLDSELELIKAKRTAVQLKLGKMRAEEDVAVQREGLAALIGVAPERVMIEDGSIPPLPELSAADLTRKEAYPDSPALLSAEANAQARMQRAQGDARYTWKPQVTFGAQYGRISPIENVGEFYNLHGNYNTASAGLQIQFPLLDRVRKAAAAVSTQDALRSLHDLAGMRAEQDANRRKLQRSIEQLQATAELAKLELQIAQTELGSTTAQTKNNTGGPPLTPKDEVAAQLQERQKAGDVLDAEFQLYKSEVFILRQTGEFAKWISTIP